MDVDKLFKLPSLPSAAVNKRKWTAPKVDEPSSSSSSQPLPEAEASEESAPRPRKAARVDDEADEEEAAAEEDETYFFSDDDQEDGRFFSGGLTAEQKQILDIMDAGSPSNVNANGVDATSVSDLPSLRKQLVRFERAINKNAEMRVKHASNPAKFLDSEADLHAELKSLLVLTTQPVLFYPEFVKLGGVGSLVGLLSHENADMAAAAIEVIEELTDDDVLDQANAESEDEDGQGEGAKALEAMNGLVEALLQQSLLDLLVSNLSRFNDVLDSTLPAEEAAAKASEVEGDAQAIYHTLGAIENLVSSRPNLSELLVSKTSFFKWALTRLAAQRSVDQNTSYAAELLAILLQSSEPNRALLGSTRIAEAENGIDVLLTILSRYRRTAPSGGEEAEFVENIFDCLCVSLSDVSNKAHFLAGEGVELMVLLMKEKKSFGRVRAVRVLDYASSGPSGGAVCMRIVEANALAPLFSVFMDCNSTSKKRERVTVTLNEAEHVLGIFNSLLTHLPSDSIERLRVLTKFVTDGYARLDHLLDLRDALVARLDSTQLANDAEEQDEDEAYLARLEQGLFSLQLLDTVLAWIVMEDDAAKDHIQLLLRRKGVHLSDIAHTLREYSDNLGDQLSVSKPANDESDSHGSTELKTKDILAALIAYLEAL